MHRAAPHVLLQRLESRHLPALHLPSPTHRTTPRSNPKIQPPVNARLSTPRRSGGRLPLFRDVRDHGRGVEEAAVCGLVDELGREAVLDVGRQDVVSHVDRGVGRAVGRVEC